MKLKVAQLGSNKFELYGVLELDNSVYIESSIIAISCSVPSKIIPLYPTEGLNSQKGLTDCVYGKYVRFEST